MHSAGIRSHVECVACCRVTGLNYYSEMHVLWDPNTRDAWDAFHDAHAGAMQQAWVYGDALKAMGVRIHRALIVEDGVTLGIAQFMCRRIAGYLSVASCTRGPLWSSITTPSQRHAAYRQLKKDIPTSALRVTLFSPDQTQDNFSADEGQGLWRVMTGYSTVLLDLAQPTDALRAALDGKWRNRLVKAEAETKVNVVTNASIPKLRWLLDRETDQRTTKNFHGLPTLFVEAYLAAAQSPVHAFALSRAEKDGHTIAAMLFLLHGRGATYHVGWADDTARQLNAHNLLLWRSALYLKDKGVTQLDLGGVNTQHLPGISRFKLGTGGRVVTLTGTYF